MTSYNSKFLFFLINLKLREKHVKLLLVNIDFDPSLKITGIFFVYQKLYSIDIDF